MYLLLGFSIEALFLLVNPESANHKNPSPRTRLQDLLVIHYDCEEPQQKHYINTQLNRSHNVNLNKNI